MSYALEKAREAWTHEVEAEMVRLIEAGVPPYDAADEARNNVAARRMRKSRYKHADDSTSIREAK